MGDLVPRKEITKQGVRGVGGIGGGIALLVLSGFGLVGGLIFGGLLTITGFVIGRSKEDRIPGGIVAGAGILTILSGIFGPGIAGTLLTISGVGLLAFGGYSLVKFLLGLRKRS